MTEVNYREAKKHLTELTDALRAIKFPTDEVFETTLGSFLALYFLAKQDPCSSAILFVDRVTSVVESLVAERSKA